MPVDLPEDRFEELVDEALDGLPDEVAAMLDNVVVVVEDGHLGGPLGLASMRALVSGMPRQDFTGYVLSAVIVARLTMFTALTDARSAHVQRARDRRRY